MNPTDLTVTVVLSAAALICACTELVCCLLLLRAKGEPEARPMLVGLAAAIGVHLSVYGLTGRAWGAAFCVLPFAAVVIMRTPRTWQAPPRRARLARAGMGELAAPPDLPSVLDNDRISWTSTVGEASVRPGPDAATDTGTATQQGSSAPLSASEQQAWESLRRSLGDS
ncbi:MAG TPA: hypothetical protein VHX59_26180 [Mycobacteriales bacterium]|nr:hypothetical protein [Mycobacteriales bacterium]